MPKSKTKNLLKSKTKLSRARLVVYACIFGVMGCVLLLRSLAAGTMTLYLSPASQSLTKGDNFSVQVRLSNSTGNSVNQVNAYLTFPADKLSVNSITLDTSIFVFGAQSFDNTAGTATIHNQAFSNLNNGDYPVATISFNAKASGTAVVSYTAQSSVVDSFRSTGGNQLTGTSGGTYTISSPAPPPPPPPVTPPKTPPPAPKTGGTGSNTPSPTPSAPAGVPAISNLQINKLDSSSVQISWTTTPAVVSVLSYGLSADKLNISLPADAAFPDHSATLVSLTPGTKYYFSVKATTNGVDALQTGDFTTLNSTAAKNSTTKTPKPGGGPSKGWLGGASVILVVLLLLVISRRLGAKPKRPRKKSNPHEVLGSGQQQPIVPAAAPPSMPAPLFQRPQPPPQPKEQPQAAPPPVVNHQLPPPHATGYPWVVGAPTARQAKPRSDSIAANDPNYVEPQDLFEEGTKRLVDEGIITIPHDPDAK